MARQARRGAITPAAVQRVGESPGLRHDVVPTEEPLEILVNGVLVGSTMRTPGNDFELAAGWCLSEGHLTGDRIGRILYCAGKGPEGNSYNVLDVVTYSGVKPVPTRLTATTASCGICGSVAVDELLGRLDPLPAVPPVALEIITAAAAALGAHQSLFARTGSVHGAAAFRLLDGSIVETREDVGRHNAVDKLVGRFLLDEELPADGLGLLLSGRVSVELVQKAWTAGFAVVAAVGGPTSLAVDAAAAARVTLVGFVRDERANVYTGALLP
jgi:FdhD protein